jgi:hypothetical protein
MAKSSLPKNSSKLNFTRRQAELFQKIILAGNRMAELLAQLEFRLIQPAKAKEADKLIKKWPDLMMQLAKMII